ncbi:MAG: hypothetical protein KJ941_11340 [Bacteroidetes bacterium]|nr:hypothetical protein [Bacteroidota bacterium]
MRKYTLIFATLVLGFGLTVTSCKKDTTDASTASAGLANNNYDLYNRLGGTALTEDPNNPGTMIESGRLTLRSVVDSTIFLIAADGEFLTKFFPVLVSELSESPANTSGLAELSENLTDFFCAATGSKNPAYAYTGTDMVTAHDPAKNPRMGAKSDNADYTKFVGFIVAGAGENGVPATSPLVSDLGKVLETLRTSIVQK